MMDEPMAIPCNTVFIVDLSSPRNQPNHSTSSCPSLDRPSSHIAINKGGIRETMAVPKQHYATSSLVIGYALCSSLLAVINKFAITKFNYPGLLTALQYLTSALGVWILGKLGFLNHDPFVWETAKKFLPAAIVFYLAIFTNTNLLRHANVDTFIVFRSLTPLLVALADTTFRKQPIPSKLTFLSLLIILGGAVGYVATDYGFTLTAYSWAFAYLITITTEMVYIKHMVTNLGLNTWGFVYYNNLLSLMMAPLFWVATGEYSDVFAAVGSNGGNLFEIVAFTAVSLSCVFGLLISFFGFACRKAISATAFTVTGVVNKFLTVAINVLIWDKHASPFGLFCLLVTIAGGILYQQSVTGVTSPSSQRDPAASKLMESKDDGDDYTDEDQEKGISGKISGV
ncbi:hypothetical protein Ccrd_004111 [Cynara cardunculus var. scolymus]|uniref:Sugar phosphate transporter domain-containing protein n=2 Tax=Cynara cardunculus var. scolymus TaxID=59895 RepID=A0A118JWA3_CYNCS|nr:hypothetical protein Ccrd_004111 [Cynara cardunculus var. scolymus]